MARIDQLKAELIPPAGEINTNVYATQPTRFTVFLRTFVPWQLYRFVAINLKMMMLIGREKRQHR